MQKTQGSWGGADSLQSAVSREAFRGYPKLKGTEWIRPRPCSLSLSLSKWNALGLDRFDLRGMGRGAVPVAAVGHPPRPSSPRGDGSGGGGAGGPEAAPGALLYLQIVEDEEECLS